MIKIICAAYFEAQAALYALYRQISAATDAEKDYPFDIAA
jgi:hypothetical protein